VVLPHRDLIGEPQREPSADLTHGRASRADTAWSAWMPPSD